MLQLLNETLMWQTVLSSPFSMQRPQFILIISHLNYYSSPLLLSRPPVYAYTTHTIRVFLKCLPELVVLLNVSSNLPEKLHSITHKSLYDLATHYVSTLITFHFSIHTLCSSYTELPLSFPKVPSFFHVSMPLHKLFPLPNTFSYTLAIQLAHHLRYVSAK